MRVELHPGIFTGDGPLSPIVRVMECVAHGRHDWSADSLTLHAAEHYFAIHAPTMGSTYLELGRKGLVDAAWRPCGTTTLVRITPSDIPDVVEDLCRPAVLVVEDLQSDGCFVRAIAKVFRADHLRRRCLAAGWSFDTEVVNGLGW